MEGRLRNRLDRSRNGRCHHQDLVTRSRARARHPSRLGTDGVSGAWHFVAACLVAGTGLIGPLKGWWSDGDRWIFAALCLPATILLVRARLRDMDEDPSDWWKGLIPVYNIYFGLRLLFTEGHGGGDRTTILLVVPAGIVVACGITAKIYADEPHDPAETATTATRSAPCRRPTRTA